MYIAFKWLLGLSLIMWFVMCTIDVYLIALKKTGKPGLKIEDMEFKYENVSAPIDAVTKRGYKVNTYKLSNNSTLGLLHYVVFCGAGFMFSIFNKRKKLLLIANTRNLGINSTICNFKKSAIACSDAMSKYLCKIWKLLQSIIDNLNIFKMNFATPVHRHEIINKILIKKIKELSEEKKNLTLLLAAANSENRNIKINYQLESISKRKVAIYTEESKKRQEGQTKYLNFQHLYLITHQENLYLHSRIKRLTKQKEDAERNLISLVHEVCLSKNEKLIAYCSRFVVQSKDELLSSDMSSEVQKFLSSSAYNAHLKLSQRPDVGTNTDDNKKSKSLELKKSTTSLSDAPRLVGLPGEHILTVKDKDGFIEKLYEYDFTTDFDKGDTIRRIREYSVYHDKDCFLENVSSRTVIQDDINGANIQASNSMALRSCKRIHNQRFLTGSPAFQIFLENSKNVILPLTANFRAPISYG